MDAASMPATHKTLHLIPDTNVFMQCRHLHELPWSTAFPEWDAIVVVLVAPVIREIDRQKGGQGRLAKRARTANSLIGRLIDSSAVELSGDGEQPIVTLVAMPELRPNPSLQDDLDYTQADDSIVGIVSAFLNAQEGRQVALLSNDNGPLMSARRVSVPFHRVPSDWLLPAEGDEDQKRLRALEGEVKRLKSAEPMCVIQPHGEPWEFGAERFQPLTEEQIQSLMAMVKERFTAATDFGSREKAEHRPGLGLSGIYALYGREEFVPASDDEIALYQKEQYPDWLSRCETCFRELHYQLQNAQELPRIEVDLLNEGSRPAEGVRVVFYLRGGGLLLKLPQEDDVSESSDGYGKLSGEIEIGSPRIALPRPPSAPTGHWKRTSVSSLMGAMEQAARLSSLARPLTPLINPPVFPTPREPDAFYWKTGSRPEYPRPGTELTCEQWRHRAEPESFEFEIISALDRDDCIGALHVEIHASNLTDPIKKAIPIRVSVRIGSTWEKATELIEQLG
ncbi:PIN domain-containing protein [Pseudomonas kuykendallii]|uniref:PIN domain-containing protein n=1 Tax=Pseudomonas kuykendallii TaxID=1007099 RepID=A0A2W5CW72_9PSED|nr:PIN domain-containing protein [Pseudomonas kuykendallii]PZP21417.1 MAG: hypothetical protein DI599_19165 [Pseudomonas kuykendallii]